MSTYGDVLAELDAAIDAYRMRRSINWLTFASIAQGLAIICLAFALILR